MYKTLVTRLQNLLAESQNLTVNFVPYSQQYAKSYHRAEGAKKQGEADPHIYVSQENNAKFG